MRILPVSLDAVLVELSGLDETLALLEALQADPVEGVVDLVPAARTLLVQFQPWVCTQAALVAQIRSRQGRPRAREQAGELVQIPVRYDGEDLPEMAAYLKLTADELVRRHAALVWTVAFTGFAPGFAYLAGGDPVFDVPRRSSPRTRIPAGSVGLAGRFSGVYPRATPGGWQLIGTTDVPMWDLARATPALLQPGMRVQFVDVATDAGRRCRRRMRVGNQKTCVWLMRVRAQHCTGLNGVCRACMVMTPGWMLRPVRTVPPYWKCCTPACRRCFRMPAGRGWRGRVCRPPVRWTARPSGWPTSCWAMCRMRRWSNCCMADFPYGRCSARWWR